MGLAKKFIWVFPKDVTEKKSEWTFWPAQYNDHYSHKPITSEAWRWQKEYSGEQDGRDPAFMESIVEQFTRTFTFCVTLNLCNPVELSPLYWWGHMNCSTQPARNGQSRDFSPDLSAFGAFPRHFLPPHPPALSVYREAHTVLRTLKTPSPLFPGGPASVTCCLLSTPPANNHSSIVFISFVAHSHCSSKFILNNTVLLWFSTTNGITIFVCFKAIAIK